MIKQRPIRWSTYDGETGPRGDVEAYIFGKG